MGRRAAAAVAALVVAGLASGCEEPGQRGARQAVQAYLRAAPRNGAGYVVGDVHCTHSGRYGYFGAVRTRRFFCTVRRVGGDCDLYQAEALPNGSARVVLVRRSAGCVLPAG